MSQKGIDVVIPRLTRSYGPTLLQSDTKAISQFIRKGVAGEDIVLKSAGTQYYSYTYVGDAVAGLLTVLLCGKTGEAYNIADDASDIMLKDLAAIIADVAGKRVVFEVPDAVEAAGYSRATKARLDSTKLQELGWKAHYDIKAGIVRTMEILKTLENDSHE
jgi:nucleoside-diphosphate-sugar epimerase